MMPHTDPRNFRGAQQTLVQYIPVLLMTFSTAPIFLDIDACNLAGVSWVIPDMKWSDHPGSADNQGLGPDYVANLLDTIGESKCTNPNDGKTYWNSTAIFIVWDDWGGWYDHVNPSTAPGLSVKESCKSSSWGCGYTYGFRVPLLVASAYTPAGYVSGNTITQGEVFPYIHDFGSILAFIENNFGVPIGSINPSYHFADNYAPDWENGRNIPLSDFFGLTTPRPYAPITVYHPVSFFTNNPAGPQGPGDGGSED
jgi:phospholipase C